jgi:flagellar hook-basal body complex protein FliE
MALAPALPIAPVAPTLVRATPAPGGAGGTFAAALGQALAGLSSLQTQAGAAAQQLAGGQAGDVATAVVAATKANMALSLAVQVRNDALSAYQQIMQMQL